MGLPLALQLRRTCDDPTTWVDCHSNLNPASFNEALLGPTLTVALEPGRYTLVTGGAVGGAANFSELVWRP